MSAPSEKTPHESWLEVLNFTGVALQARPVMKEAQTQADRDSATRIYVNAVDRVIDTLEVMAQRGHLNDVGAFLDAQFGRV